MKMNLSETGHKIDHRENAKDGYTTPLSLAKKCIKFTPLKKEEIVLDPCRGNGAFYSQYPDFVEKKWCELEEGRDFFEFEEKVDWIISNPPYSKLDKWLLKSCQVAKKGFGYLLAVHSITPRRLEFINEKNFGLVFLHLCKVFKWYGMSAFVIFEKGKENIFSYDREVWRHKEGQERYFPQTKKENKEINDFL